MKHRKKRNKSSSASSTSTKWKVASERKIINTQLKIQEVTRWDIWAGKKKKKATISVVVSSPPQGAVYPEGYWRVRGVKINQLTSSHKQPLQLCYKETMAWPLIKAGDTSPWARKDSMYSSWVYPICFPTHAVYGLCIYRGRSSWS